MKHPQRQYLYSAFIVLLACLVLFSVDRETHHVSQLFTPQNLFALLLYFVPTYLLCLVLYRILRKREIKNSFGWSLGMGIPVGFLVVIVSLAAMMGRI